MRSPQPLPHRRCRPLFPLRGRRPLLTLSGVWRRPKLIKACGAEPHTTELPPTPFTSKKKAIPTACQHTGGAAGFQHPAVDPIGPTPQKVERAQVLNTGSLRAPAPATRLNKLYPQPHPQPHPIPHRGAEQDRRQEPPTLAKYG
jgi:hypothetical protein